MFRYIASFSAGQRVVIYRLDDAQRALVGETGAHILSDNAFN